MAAPEFKRMNPRQQPHPHRRNHRLRRRSPKGPYSPPPLLPDPPDILHTSLLLVAVLGIPHGNKHLSPQASVVAPPRWFRAAQRLRSGEIPQRRQSCAWL